MVATVIVVVVWIQLFVGAGASCPSCATTCGTSASVSSSIFFSRSAGSCPAGSVMSIGALNIASTDDSQFKVYLRTSSGGSNLNVAWSNIDRTCFDMSQFYQGGVNAGTTNLGFLISCSNLIFSCPLKYDVIFQCSSTPSPTPSPSTPSPTPSPSTPSPTPASTQCNGPSCCSCSCCTGNFCTPTQLPTFAINSCSGLSCDASCRSYYSSDCPASGASGSVGSSCSSGSSPSPSPAQVCGKVQVFGCSNCACASSNTLSGCVESNTCYTGSGYSAKAVSASRVKVYSDSACSESSLVNSVDMGSCVNGVINGQAGSVSLSSMSSSGTTTSVTIALLGALLCSYLALVYIV